jgi:hypothetical protein
MFQLNDLSQDGHDSVCCLLPANPAADPLLSTDFPLPGSHEVL